MRCAGRPATPADAPAIVALLAQAGMHVEPQNLHWQYWQPRADWAGPRSFVLANGSAIVAHGGVIPGSCAWESRRIRTLHVIDWVANPREIGAGVALMNYIGQQAEALLAIGGGPQTMQILPKIGFRATGTATGYARSLSPLRLLRDSGQRNWRLLPRFVRSLAWRLTAPAAAPGDGWQARRIAADDLEQIASVLPTPARGMGVLRTQCWSVPLRARVSDRSDAVVFGRESRARARLLCACLSPGPGPHRRLLDGFRPAGRLARDDQLCGGASRARPAARRKS